jgi:hypothetical protein
VLTFTESSMESRWQCQLLLEKGLRNMDCSREVEDSVMCNGSDGPSVVRPGQTAGGERSARQAGPGVAERNLATKGSQDVRA